MRDGISVRFQAARDFNLYPGSTPPYSSPLVPTLSDRLQKIHRLATAHALERNEKFVGREEEVLIRLCNFTVETQMSPRFLREY